VTITAVAGETYSFDSGYILQRLFTAGSQRFFTYRNRTECSGLYFCGFKHYTQRATSDSSGTCGSGDTAHLYRFDRNNNITGVAGETYSFDASPYGATLVFSGWQPAQHTVLWQKCSGCFSIVTTVTLNAQPATPAAPTLTATHPTCTLATGSVTITAVAGKLIVLTLEHIQQRSFIADSQRVLRIP
jgi:hypothetical protein